MERGDTHVDHIMNSSTARSCMSTSLWIRLNVVLDSRRIDHLGEDSRLGPTPELDHTIVALDRQQLENGQISIIAK